MELAKGIAQRILKNLPSSTEEMEQSLIFLIEEAIEGHLCSIIQEPLPVEICSLGVDTEPYPKTPLVRQENRLYLQKNWALETLILIKISELLAREPIERDEALFALELTQIPSLLEAQKLALQQGFQRSLTIFTGGPGTGKTYTASWFIRLLAQQKKGIYKVAIAAPTGKAAAHLASALHMQGPLPEYLKCESTTLHRLLKLQPGMQRFYADWTIAADLVVIDEASMLDPSMLLHLLYAIGPATRLLLLGDPYQLSPIEGGSLFPDMAALFGQKLERSIRMGEGELFALSQAILTSQIEKITHEEIEWTKLIDEVMKRLPNPIYPTEPDPLFCLEEQKKFRLLCVLRQGPYGVDALNRDLVARFQAKSGWFALPILIVENDPKQQLYNGTTGVLIGKKAYFSSPEGVRMIPEGALPRYDPAFFLSVHKSQGSEFEEVLAIFPPGSERFGKEALYTAVTRAKRKVTIWIDPSTLDSTLQVSGKKRSGFIERFKSAQ